MAKYVYPAVFEEENGKFYAKIPDLKGCCTTGDTLAEAIEMARDAAGMWLCLAEDGNEEIPPANMGLKAEDGIVSFIDADTIEYRKMTDNKTVKKTLSIPSWLNFQAEKAGVNFSNVLQEALKKELNIH